MTIILTFGPISGAHLNPVVTLADASQGGLPRRAVVPYPTSGRSRLRHRADCGAPVATLLFRWLVPALPQFADLVVVPHETPRKEPD